MESTKTIIGKNSHTSAQRLSVYVNDKTIIDSTDIANEFNKFFCVNMSSIDKKIISTKNTLSYVDSISNTIVIFHVYCAEDEHAISTLENYSAGRDEIPKSMAKKCITSFIEPLTYLINKSFSEGIFHTELKLDRVVPILKEGDPMFLTNYRPIYILTFFSKIFEKLMYCNIF